MLSHVLRGNPSFRFAGNAPAHEFHAKAGNGFYDRVVLDVDKNIPPLAVLREIDWLADLDAL